MYSKLIKSHYALRILQIYFSVSRCHTKLHSTEQHHLNCLCLIEAKSRILQLALAPSHGRLSILYKIQVQCDLDKNFEICYQGCYWHQCVGEQINGYWGHRFHYTIVVSWSEWLLQTLTSTCRFAVSDVFPAMTFTRVSFEFRTMCLHLIALRLDIYIL